MKKIVISLGALVLILVATWFVTRPKTDDKPVARVKKDIYNFDPAICPGPTVDVKMSDPYMRGIIEEETSVSVKLNWFACNPIQKDQIVLYRFSQFDDPVLRRVVGVAKDRFELVSVKKNGWYLKVNGKPVTGVNGSYYFGGEMPPPLALAEKAKKAVLGPNDVILFSSFGPGDRDSGIFGVVSVKDIVGIADVQMKRISK